MDELTLCEDKLTNLLQNVPLYSTALSSLKFKIMDIKTGFRNRYYNVMRL